jgi:hypothetical protein
VRCERQRAPLNVCHADSTVLIHVLTALNERFEYGLDLFLLSVDEGITGYRDDSLEVRFSRPCPLGFTSRVCRL